MKKYVSIILCVILALSVFVGCQDAGGGSAETAPVSVTSEGTVNPTETPPVTDTPATSEDPTTYEPSESGEETEPVEATEEPVAPTSTIIDDNEECEHEFVEVEREEADCEKSGLIVSVCSVCGAEKREDIPALGHDWQFSRTVTPTCKEKGYDLYTCSRCKKIQKKNTTDRVAHTWELDEVVEPTCTEKGYDRYRCSVCGAIEKRNEKAALGHKWGEWTQTSAPTCTRDGKETRSCSRCGKTETRSVAKLGHDWQFEKTVAPTCTEKGYDLYKCSRCGATEKRNEKAALGHNWGSWTQTTAPTCTQKGVETRTCSRCGKTETRDVSKLGHDWQFEKTVAPTCTETGYDQYKCSRCGSTEKRNEKAALGHNWGSWSQTSAPTCTKDGVETRTCSRCGENETRAVAAQGHDFKFKETVRPTESSEGYDLYECSRCDATEKRNVKPKLYNMAQAMSIGNNLLSSYGVAVDTSLSVSGSAYSMPDAYSSAYLARNGGQSKLNEKVRGYVQAEINGMLGMGWTIEGANMRCYVCYKYETDEYLVYVLRR